MKNLILENNVWIEKINPNITIDEKNILENQDISMNEIKKQLIESIKIRSHKNAEPQDAIDAQAVYDKHKIPDADLISVDLSLPNKHGIINCRVNGEHIQIRF